MSGRHNMPPAGRRKAAAAEESSEPETLESAEAAETPETPEAPEEVLAEDPADAVEPADAAAEPTDPEPAPAPSRGSVPVVLAAIALVLALTCAVLRWLIVSGEESTTARDEAIQAAKEIAAEMLSYETETVDQQLTAARDRMTGDFRDTYTAMIDEVIPAAHAQQIGAVADVLRAGTVSVQPRSVELVLFVNQSVRVGTQAPQKTASIARATMVKVDDRWLLSEYEPVPL